MRLIPALAWRLWPRTMAGQLISLLLAGLLAAHLIAVLVVINASDVLHGISRHYVLDQVSDIYRFANGLVESAPRDGTADVSVRLRAFEHANAHFGVGAASAIDARRALDSEEQGLRTLLQRRTGLPPQAVQVHLQRHDDGDPGLAISLRLSDGRWMNSTQRPIMNRQWWRPLRFSIPVSTLPVLIIVIIFIRRILQPMKALAQAAESVSRGEPVTPLPVSGPQEAREVTASFNIMQSRLSRYLDDQARMLASISHDLRTPITSLRLRAEMIDDAALRTAMQRTLAEMAVMVQETLRFASDEAQAEATGEVDLAQLLRDIVADQQALGRDVRLPLAPPAAGLRCRCRPIAVKRALTNLVENAVRYGSRARIGVQARRAGGERLLGIVIDDDGPGVPADQLEQVFKPFFRLDPARSPQTGGVGLGLAIARSCLEAHGGQLTLENRVAGGLRAVATLPACTEQGATAGVLTPA